MRTARCHHASRGQRHPRRPAAERIHRADRLSDALCNALETALRKTWDHESIACYAADYSGEEVA